MDGGTDGGSEARFAGYVEQLGRVLGHADRRAPLHDYCLGLLLPIERKSVEPMAAVTAPAQVAAKHQSLLHFVGNAPWSDAAMLAKVSEEVLAVIECSGPIEAWIIDDTGFPKKGRHSVGVTRQYCGQLGKQDNCQVAVSLSLANHDASLPVAYRLYLPEEWAQDQERRAKAKVPDTIAFQTKPEIALDQIKAANAAGLPPGVVLMDAGYGNDTRLRTQITALALRYVAGIGANTTVWPPGMAPLPPLVGSGRGRPPKLLRRDGEHQPVSAKALAQALPPEAWHEIAWREGSADWLCSRFARMRVRPAHRDTWRAEPHPQEWLLIEWPPEEREPTKYWLSTLPEEIAFDRLVDLAKLRWRIERDYQELKQELGLGDYEGRGWRGFHHHATLCIAAYGFLIAERGAFPPSAPAAATLFPGSGLPDDYRPRGAPDPARTACAELDRQYPPMPDRRPRQDASEMPLLQLADQKTSQNSGLLTQ
jgi:SRSO17 transposase